MAAPTPAEKPQKSKFFRVASEGATTDGRAITRQQIEQMAKNFSPQKYGARVWLEHLRGVHPESTFRAYGDVIAVEARDIEDGKRGLFAQIKPLPDLVAMVKKGQKIYTSIEVSDKFADTGEAYLVGLGVTDSPASLGTDVLTFAAQKPEANPFASRKQHAENVFSAATVAELEFEDDAPADEGVVAKFTATITGLVGRFKSKAASDDARFAEVLTGFEAFAEFAEKQGQAHDSLQAEHGALVAKFNELSGKHDALVKKLESTPESGYSARPPAPGGDGGAKTDC